DLLGASDDAAAAPAGDIELVRTKSLDAVDLDLLVELLLELVDVLALVLAQELAHPRRALHLDDIGLDQVANPADLAEHLVGHRGRGLDHAVAVAGRAGLGQELAERLARALAGHLHEAELADLGDVAPRA